MEWWHGLGVEAQVFWAVALISSGFLALQMLLSMVGVHHDAFGHADPGLGDVHVLSSRTIVAFAVGFGWTGVACLGHRLPLLPTVGCSLLVGGLLLLAVFQLMTSMMQLRSSGSLDYRNAIGQTATVYVPIPAERGGGGQVEVMVQGRLAVVNAATAGAAIRGQARVKVVDLVDATTLLVEPIA